MKPSNQVPLKTATGSYIMMVFAALFWAGNFIAGKYGLEGMSPVLMTTFRMFFAFIIMLPLYIIKVGRRFIPKKSDIGIFMLTGASGAIGYNLFLFNALRYTSVTKASMLAALIPILTAILATALRLESISKRKHIFIFTALLGVLLTISDWSLPSLFSEPINKGDFLMFGSALSWAIYTILIKRYSPRYTNLTLSLFTFLSAWIMLLPFAIRSALPISWENIGFNSWLAVLYMAIFPTILSYGFQQKSLRNIGPSRTNLFINLVPLFSMILSVFVLHEKFNPLNIYSFGIIVASVILFSREHA